MTRIPYHYGVLPTEPIGLAPVLAGIHQPSGLRPRRTRRIEEALHEDQIQPATKLVTDFSKMGDWLEPEAPMKSD